MARREVVRVEDLAALDNLAAAFWRAASGKRQRREVRAFESDLDRELAQLSRGILDLSVPVGRMRVFEIRDPKRRTIHAPCFRERVLHHALMARVGPPLERSLVDDTFACRSGKGTLAAVLRAQRHSRRFGYFGKLDARAYFMSIRHCVLRNLLRRRIRGKGTLTLLGRIIASHESTPGRGLPIGALTSQHFANLYLGGIDRLILEQHRVGLVRYMDDIVLWADKKGELRAAMESARELAQGELFLDLEVMQPPTSTSQAVPLCGYRIYRDRLLLSRRRSRRFRRARRRWETAFDLGLLDSGALQAGYASALATTAHADALALRQADLARREPPDA